MSAPAANFVVPPMIWRELLAAYRRHDPRKARQRVSWVGAGLAAVILLANAFGAPFGFAQTLHQWLFFYGVYLAVPNALQLTGGMFAQERQNQCFGFLFLAGLGMPEIFISKLAGSLLIAATELLALAPFLSIPFLAGGISFALFSATLIVLPTLLLFTLALSAFGSSLCEEESTAKAVSVGVGAALCVLVPAIYWLKGWSGHRISDNWLLLTPAYAPWLIAFGSKTRSGLEVWRNCGLTLGWSFALFVAAAFTLRKTWRRETSGYIARPSHFQSFWRVITQRRNRRAWLDTNPMTWLAIADPRPERLAWSALAILVALWIVGFALASRYWLNNAVFFLTATILDGLFDALFCYTAAKFMADQRRTSAIELLLTTPLPDFRIVDGQYAALRARFQPVLAAVIGLNACLMLVGLFLRPMNWRAVTVYLFIWAVLIVWPILRWQCPPWKIIWRALCCGQPFLAMRSRPGSGWPWIGNLINLRNAFSHGVGGFNFPSGSVVEFVIVVVVALVATAILAGKLYHDEWLGHRSELLLDLRLIAVEPLPEHNDPRFKKWDRATRLPPLYKTVPLTVAPPRRPGG